MTLSAGQLKLLSQWFDEVVDLRSAEREAWFARQGEGHEDLNRCLRQMLDEHDGAHAEGFLEALPRLDEALVPESGVDTARQGERVGPYLLVREIGRGGMGTVWLAERADGAFKRQVALKLPRLAWGAGLAERMARERDIGAMLEHPHIARLYDAGVDALGRPYLAMEHIEGLAIDEHGRLHHLPVREKVKLLLQVARALAYAHGRLVVHRDLKPGNVLVDEDGQARLLDFGIAKLLDDASEHQPELTQGHAGVLTPRYASPEQLNGAPVSVQTDVYGLGLLAFEVLSGALPYGPVGASALDRRQLHVEIEQGVRRLASEQTPDPLIRRQLRGDLDAILGKALKADPRERYRSVDALADDLQCWLDSKPVSARPDSLIYRWKKAARRHWVGLGAVSAVLVAGLALAAILVVNHQRAEQAASRERLITDFVSEVFHINQRRDPTPAASSAPDGLKGDAFLRATAPIIEKRFAGEPAMQARLYGVVAALFDTAGLPEQAVEYASLQTATLRKVGHPPVQTIPARLLEARALFGVRRYPESEALVREVLGTQGLELTQRADAVELLARNLFWRTEMAEVEGLLDELDRLAAQIGKPTLAQAEGFVLRGSLLSSRARFADAQPWFHRGIELAERVEGPESSAAAIMRIKLGEQMSRSGAPVAEAKAMISSGLDARRRMGGLIAVTSDAARAFYWRLLFQRRGVSFNEVQDALRQAESSVASAPATPDPVRQFLAFDRSMAWVQWGDLEQGWPELVQRGQSYVQAQNTPMELRIVPVLNVQRASIRRGEHVVARQWGERAMAMREQMGQSKQAIMAQPWIAGAYNLSMAGHIQEAMTYLQSLETNVGWPAIAADPRVRRQLEQVQAHLLADAGQFEAAAERLKALPATQPSGIIAFDTPDVLRARVDCQTGRAAQGLELLVKLLAQGMPDRYPHSPEFAWVRGHMALCALKLNDLPRAKSYADLATESFRIQPQVSAYFKQPLAEFNRLTATSNTPPAKP